MAFLRAPSLFHDVVGCRRQVARAPRSGRLAPQAHRERIPGPTGAERKLNARVL